MDEREVNRLAQEAMDETLAEMAAEMKAKQNPDDGFPVDLDYVANSASVHAPDVYHCNAMGQRLAGQCASPGSDWHTEPVPSAVPQEPTPRQLRASALSTAIDFYRGTDASAGDIVHAAELFLNFVLTDTVEVTESRNEDRDE